MAAAALLLALAAPASAAPVRPALPATAAEPDLAAAKAVYAKGDAAFRAERFDQALAHVSEAWSLNPNASTAIILAVVYQRLSRQRDAIGAFLAALELDASDQERAFAASELEALCVGLDPPCGWLEIRTSVPDATISVSGVTWSGPGRVAVDVGNHVVTVEAPGHIGEERVLAISAGAGVLFDVSLEPLAAGGLSPPPEVAPAAEPEEPARGPSLVGPIALLVSGAVVAAAGAPVTVWTFDRAGDASKAPTEDAHGALVDEIETAQLAAGILYAAGGVIAAAGLTWLIIELSSSDDASPSIAVPMPRLVPGGVGVTLGASF